MQIIEYDKKYEEDCKDLLVELEEYLVSIDEDELDQVGEEYREKMLGVDFKELEENEGKCFIAVEDGNVTAEFSVLLKIDVLLPKGIIELTGITDEMLRESGRDAREALEGLKEFCGDKELVGHNLASFDMKFLRRAFSKSNLEMMKNKVTDTLRMSSRRIDDCEDYGLADLAKYFKIEYGNLHRALDDCLLTYKVFEELKKI